MNKFRLTIKTRIIAGFLLLIVIFGCNALISFTTLENSQAIIRSNSEDINPSVTALHDFSELLLKSKMYSTNWVYLQANTDDKKDLKDLHKNLYPTLKIRLNNLKKNWDNPEHISELDSIFTSFEEMLASEKEIMALLVSFDDYQNPLAKFTAEDLIEKTILIQTATISERLSKLVVAKQAEAAAADKSLLVSFGELRIINTVSGILTVIFGLVGALFVANSITTPINKLKEVIIKLGHGVLPDSQSSKFKNDEIGEMEKAVDKLVKGLISTSEFAETIGKGEYDNSYQPLSEEDILGNALILMRDNLKKVSEEDKKRNWIATGVARFSDILRSEHENIEVVTNNILQELIMYVEANQGGIFIVNDDNRSDVHLEMVACYAYDRRKFLEKRVDVGEGLVGQSYQENDKIFLTDVPEEYVSISSGLGEANPTSILIIPLSINEETVGVLELASFKVFEDHEVEFIEKIAENTASSIASVKINHRTKKLLEESQLSAEQLRSQEEEMRQNTEELQATQEEYERRINELERQLELKKSEEGANYESNIGNSLE
ncbi:GAF domain-containing protein [Flammeovirgaceae bacterium SG7u.111]|nr:GAF domain-containing protein [Flammeovirgaceae bacterium SG7u.132]WPO37050.1 GAF domain-containing protein [Flammeovirgaceae bacterium SG7u.111]